MTLPFTRSNEVMAQFPRLHWSIRAVTLLTASVSVVALGRPNWFKPPFSGKPEHPDAVGTALDVPRSVRPAVRPLFAADSPEAVSLSRALNDLPTGPVNVSYCCHLLRLFSQGPLHHPRFTSGRQILRALTNHEQAEVFFGQPIFFQTRSGIRYSDPSIQTITNGENHRDICLGTFAEAGLPLSTEFATPQATFSLRDLLRDSVENFHLQQEELSWTAVAFALYLESGVRWTNRFNETFDWDELTKALLATPLARGSCGGTHVFYALIVIRRVDATDPLLSAPVRAQLDERLKALIAAAGARQAADGHWPVAGWAESPSTRPDPNGRVNDAPFVRLLITGHLLECLTLAPPGLEPPEDVFRRAARWLCHALDDKQTLTGTEICPRTHALCAVRALVDGNRMPGALGAGTAGRSGRRSPATR